MGTMAGAEIGGVIGEALGWMSTSRHDGPGKAMLGSIVGTVAGAAIGNALTKEKTTTVGRRDNVRDNRRYEEDFNPNYRDYCGCCCVFCYRGTRLFWKYIILFLT